MTRWKRLFGNGLRETRHSNGTDSGKIHRRNAEEIESDSQKEKSPTPFTNRSYHLVSLTSEFSIWNEKKPGDSYRIPGLQSRTAIYNGNYKSILDIVLFRRLLNSSG
ncbi:hypothetical protein AB3N59_09415 [Leptospira sp. WS92.C1]